jgi:hypothetical protein
MGNDHTLPRLIMAWGLKAKDSACVLKWQVPHLRVCVMIS